LFTVFNTKVCNVLCRLFLVGYGVTYIQPTYQSLLHLQDYGNDTGLEKQGQVKVCLIDQEAHREFCDENQLVVGTPVLQMYYNAKSIKFRFLNSYESQVQASDPSKRVNIYIGQLHFAMINSLVQMTFQAIQVSISSFKKKDETIRSH
jgi:hypothetical protein